MLLPLLNTLSMSEVQPSISTLTKSKTHVFSPCCAEKTLIISASPVTAKTAKHRRRSRKIRLNGLAFPHPGEPPWREWGSGRLGVLRLRAWTLFDGRLAWARLTCSSSTSECRDQVLNLIPRRNPTVNRTRQGRKSRHGSSCGATAASHSPFSQTHMSLRI